jgi:ABC-2 type transport system permease protein
MSPGGQAQREPRIVRTPLVSFRAIHVMWLREMLRTLRAPSRLVGSLMMPLLLLAFLGFGLRGAVATVPGRGGYLAFLAPGMMGMTLMMGSVFSGLHVLWDRKFGFLREIMVTPVSRLSILLGRIAGGMTMALAQGLFVGVGAVALGVRFDITPSSVAVAFVAMVLICVSFVSLGVVFATLLDDFHGFSLIMNFVVFPIFFLSGAIFPVENLPAWVRPLCLADPLTYGVDLMRGALVGSAAYPAWLSLTILGAFCAVMLAIGSALFSRLEVT